MLFDKSGSSTTAVAARSSGRAEIFRERLDREQLRDPETGVEYFVATLRPFFVKDLQSVFLYRFSRGLMLRLLNP